MGEILIAPRVESQAEAVQPHHRTRSAAQINTGSSLAARLAAPFRSTDELLRLLVPPLAHLGLLHDHPQLCIDYGAAATSTDESFDTKRFLRRQIGLVQKALVQQTWPDWEHAVVAQHGPAGVAVFERYFVPPSSVGELSVNAAEIAISAIGVLSSFLAVKTASQLPPRVLQLALDLLARLSGQFSLEQLYFATIGHSSSSLKQERPREEAGPEEADPLEMARWEATLRNILAIPFKAANAAGAAASADGPSRVSNALRNLPPALDSRPYQSALAHSFASLLWRLAGSSASVPASPTALAQPLSSLVSDPSFVPTLAPVLLPRFLPIETFPASSEQLLQRQRHIDLWRRTIGELSEREQERFLREWIRVQLLEDAQDSASRCPSGIESPGQRSAAMAFILETLFGALDVDNQPLWESTVAILLVSGTAPFISLSTSRSVLPRAVGIWAASETAKVAFLEATMKVWSSAEEIKLGSESRRLYLTSLLLHLVVSLPVRHSAVIALSRSPDFLEAVSSHLSLVAPLTRLLGMLVAEVVSSRTVDPAGDVKPLAFGDEIWAGEGSDKETIRTLRALLSSAEKRDDEINWQDALRSRYAPSTATSDVDTQRPAPRLEREPLKPTSVEEPPPPPRPKRPLISIIGEDDDDADLEPYDLPPPPSASVQAALDSEDPALYQSAFPSQSAATSGAAGAPSQTRKRGRLRPPVYIAELVSYLQGKDPQGAKEEADGEAERIEMGLKEGESLIRRKAGWGGELRENAVDLAFALMGLQNQFDLEDFDRHKQAMLVALIVARPTEVAPAVIEQYFTDSYSIAQRHSLLAALAFAARELAGLPIPTASGDTPQPKSVEATFPSKQLPPAMHDHLVKRRRNLGSEESERVELLATDLTQMALSGARADAETTIPQAAREKALSVNRTTRRSAGLVAKSAATSSPTTTTATFSTLAAEVFILPLINRFWLYLRYQATSGRHSSGGSYLGGSAVPQLLEPILLSRFLATVTVLVHAARHSPAFLAVVVPETLSFVLMLRPIVSSSSSHHANNTLGAPESARDEDLVVASALELALAALDGTVHLDGGRMLMSSSVANGSGGALVADIKDWAEHVFEAEERKGNGDLTVGRPGRAAAGVLLRVEEIVGKWRLSVGW